MRADNGKALRDLLENEVMPFFDSSHLPEDLRRVTAPFQAVAAHIMALGQPSFMMASALRKLLESKDAAVRARLFKAPEVPAEKKET